jgi:hypothetical protein
MRALHVAFLAGSLAALAAVPALAGPTVRTSLSLRQVDNGVFAGQAKSVKPRCGRGRTVTLAFRYAGGETLRLGTRTTNRKGRYKFTDVMFDGSGEIYAKVLAAAGCRAATSNKIFIGGT